MICKSIMKMSKSSERILPSFLILLSAILLSLDVQRLCKAIRVEQSGVCDDGKYMIDKDLGGEGNWSCHSEEYTVTEFMEPAGHSQCRPIVESTYRCMVDDLRYDDHPPSSGDYRPVAPKYGEYEYLPPQRWLHALQRGGLAFLYHPCAPMEQVLKLKELAKSCLRRHIITPYPFLPKDQPLAIVSWGCVYRMSWVDDPVVRLWIREHALKAEGSSITSDGQYDKGLLHGPVLNSDEICGDHNDPSDTTQHSIDSEHSNTNDISSAPPCKSNSSANSHDQPSHAPCPQLNEDTPIITIHAPYGNTLTILIVLLSLVLFVALLIVLWRVCAAIRDRCARKKQARYKSVSKFFPFSYGQESSNGVAIPEYGLPKNRAAEREILLNDSDEDEL